MATEGQFYEGATGNPGGWTRDRLEKIPEYKARIVQMIAEGLFPSEFCPVIDMSVPTYRVWRARDKEFDQACADAQDAYVDRIEKEAVRRAMTGVAEPVVSNGRVVMDPKDPGNPLMVRRFSDSLMMFILKGRRRDVYGDKSEVQQTTKFDVTGVKEELARKISAMTGQKVETDT